jgi:glycosyltransferase involved in cell wall biosynthesis
MRAALDMRPTSVPGTGIARYAASLAAALDARTDLEIHLLYKTDPGALGRVRGTRVIVAAPAWLQGFVPLYCVRANVQVFHGTNFVVPLAHRCAQVATIHDLTVITHPHLHTVRNRLITGIQMRVGLRQCDAVITDSANTAAELAARYPWLRERTHVIRLAVPEHFRPASLNQVAALRRRYELTRPYVLFVGHQEPRKNLRCLLEAVARCRLAGSWSHELVLAGPPGPETEALISQAARMGLKEEVKFLGMVPDIDLPTLMSGASIFVYPSITEGFGLPLLEAMACGVPVVTTSEGALREVAGNTVVYARSPSGAHLAEAILSTLADEHGCRERVEAALKRATGRTWAHVAAETADIYRRAHERWSSGRNQTRHAVA